MKVINNIFLIVLILTLTCFSTISTIKKSNLKTNDQQYNINLTNAINKFRANHGVAPLTLDTDLCNLAQSYAGSLAASSMMIRHSHNKWNGEFLFENLAYANVKIPAATLAEMWYNAIKNYNFNNPGELPSPDNYSFVQMIWKSAQKIGVGMAISPKGEYYVIAYFYPSGLVFGQLSNNVLPRLY